MTHIKPTPEAEKLTAEEEATWRQRAASGERKIVGRNFYRRLFATLDASRAETKTVREDMDHARALFRQAAQIALASQREYRSLRSLAADLVEGLDEVADKAEVAMRREGGEGYHSVEMARALIARARALGIGGEEEKGNG